MTRTSNFRVFPICLTFLLFGGLTGLFGQEPLTFEGRYAVGQYEGQARFAYEVAAGDTLFVGPFSIEKSNLRALLNERDTTFLFRGRFERNIPVGPWTFQFGEFTSSDDSQIEGFQYRIPVTGTQEQANGSLIGGRPDGPWVFRIDRIENAEVVKTLFKSEFEFAAGIPQQSFKIEGEDATLVGRFLRNGLAHDEWTLYSDDALGGEELWSFTEGILTAIKTSSSESSVELPLFDAGAQNLETIALDSRYIQVLKIMTEGRYAPFQQASGIYGLLAQNDGHYQRVDQLLNQLGDADFMPELRVKVASFPLDSLERNAVTQINAANRNSLAICTELLNNSQLNILKLSDERAGELYEVISGFNDAFVKPISQLAAYDREGVLPYVSRVALLRDIWPEGKPSVRIEKGEGRGIYEGPGFNALEMDREGLAYVAMLSAYVDESLNAIALELDERLSNDKRQQELISYEERMVAYVKGLEQGLDSLERQRTGPTVTAVAKITQVANADVRSYADQPVEDGQLETAKTLIECLERMNVLAAMVADIPERTIEIKTTYTDQVWNPFMATIMDEEVKKRIINAYERILIPDLLQRISNDLDCNNVALYISQLQGLYKRMAMMRDEDTSKLERKLRKIQDPDAVWQLFNLPTNEQ
ncbi:hypothetical protein ABV409_08575 [Flagellimonas sp. DF-77]|uniref:hypothetical protein n=1 Tax=Flagellimonas algarum TaxID=3230298 RepID=UPI003393DF04